MMQQLVVGGGMQRIEANERLVERRRRRRAAEQPLSSSQLRSIEPSLLVVIEERDHRVDGLGGGFPVRFRVAAGIRRQAPFLQPCLNEKLLAMARPVTKLVGFLQRFVGSVPSSPAVQGSAQTPPSQGTVRIL